MAKTIAEKLKDWWKANFGTLDPPPSAPQAPETQVFNPYKARVESTVLTVGILDLDKYNFRVKEINEYKLDYGAKNFHYTDYLCETTLSEDSVKIIVRVYPSEKPGVDHQVLVLKQWDTVAYDEGFKGLLDDDRFDLQVDGAIESSFWRINGVKTPYKVRVTNIAKSGGSAKKDVQTIHVWDYWRDGQDEAGSPFKEFLFVNWDEDGRDDGEQDRNTGNFELWRGEEIVPSRVSLLRG
jgi:hypothetical protein